MVILESLYVLEWLDVFMLRVLPTTLQHSTKVEQEKPAKVLVFTIQEELFETEFRARSPIDRLVLKKYLKTLKHVYPKFNVLAIDYDLSPTNLESDPGEQKAQKDLDEFLFSLTKKQMEETHDGTEQMDRTDEPSVHKVVLLKHFPVRNQIVCKRKIKWEREKYVNDIFFANSEVLHYGIFGPVVKYDDSDESFPAIVFATANRLRLPVMQFTCDDSEPSSRHDSNHKLIQRIKPINFLQALTTDSVKVCALDELETFQRCKDYLGSWTDDVKVIFFGGHYGRDDIYLTPLGNLPGVTVQAYTYFSMEHPLKQIGHFRAWIIDIGLGFITGMIFHKIWQMFHKCRHSQEDRFSQQVVLLAVNFLFLIGSVAGLMFLMAHLLATGMWMNPAPMLIGLFIDSYVATTGGDAHDAISNDLKSFLRGLFGSPSDGAPVLAFFFRGLFGVVIFWIAVGTAVGILSTSH